MQLHGQREAIEAKGAVLHMIGNGNPSFIEGFRELTEYTGTIYTDPSLKTYEAVGLLRSVRATFNPRSFGKAFKSFTKGRRQGSTQGDAFQQGGALVVSTDSEVLFTYRATNAGDNVSPEALARAL